MSNEPIETVGHLLTPTDHETSLRAARMHELGLRDFPDKEFDEFAYELAQATGAPFAMVNFISDERQYFAGLYVAPRTQTDSALAVASAPTEEPDREMPRDHGYCPHVVVRRLPLVLDDVCDYPRFAGNPVVDKIGIRSYLGAPLIDRTGTALGTICVVDREPRPWGRPGLELIKERAAELVSRIHRRGAEGE
ncbi:GAF domain-containing protein [Spinactinospora alkalitolerans]|uniref:GAF domain-containing protein n=1 Tax=Spinactinospora alkalitolerans TaxID=687207 RepID=A0A852TQB0_9ACTN|nr:GAF domain-containing protein [Spinactinospora alkalitolerans]NYE45012.1 GAF domain-containing protein [Spinactinospora alkalitolerans]